MKTKAFFSMALIAMLIVIALGVFYTFSQKGRTIQAQSFSHIQTQMQFYQLSLKNIFLKCLSVYELSICEDLQVQLEGGYLGRVAIAQAQGEWYFVDFLVEYLNPMSQHIMRETRREMWKLTQDSKQNKSVASDSIKHITTHQKSQGFNRAIDNHSK